MIIDYSVDFPFLVPLEVIDFFVLNYDWYILVLILPKRLAFGLKTNDKIVQKLFQKTKNFRLKFSSQFQGSMNKII